jgi:hypothetical protein
MFNDMTRAGVIRLWFSVIALAVVWTVAFGTVISVSTAFVLLALCFVPPAIVLLVWPGAQGPTVAEVLHGVDRRV